VMLAHRCSRASYWCAREQRCSRSPRRFHPRAVLAHHSTLRLVGVQVASMLTPCAEEFFASFWIRTFLPAAFISVLAVDAITR